jgi:hypothetical protein
MGTAVGAAIGSLSSLSSEFHADPLGMHIGRQTHPVRELIAPDLHETP